MGPMGISARHRRPVVRPVWSAALRVAFLAPLAVTAVTCGCSPKGSAPVAAGPAGEAEVEAKDEPPPMQRRPDNAPPAEAPLARRLVVDPTGPEYELVDPLPEDPELDMLLEAMQGDDPKMRFAAVENAITMPGEEVTIWCVGQMRKATPAVRAAILRILAGREDMAGLATALEAMRDPDESVRLAAVRAVAGLGKEMVVGPLVRFLGGERPAERAAAKKALLEMPGAAATRALAESMADAPPRGRCALLEILAGRHATAHVDVVLAAARDEDISVRISALKALSQIADEDLLPSLLEILLEAKGGRELKAAERAAALTCARAEDRESCAGPMLAALAKSEGKARCSLLRALGRLGAPSGLPAIRAALKDPKPDLRDAAARSLADWPDASVASDLLSLARGETVPFPLRVLALRGYVRVVGLPSDRPPEETLAMYEAAASLADEWDRPQEKKQVLAGLAGVRDVRALRMTLPYLGDEALTAEAAVAVVKIAGSLGRSHSPGDIAEARVALADVIEAVDDEGVKGQALEALEALGPPPAGM